MKENGTDGVDFDGIRRDWRVQVILSSADLEGLSPKGMDRGSAMTCWDTRHEVYMTGCVVCKHWLALDVGGHFLQDTHLVYRQH